MSQTSRFIVFIGLYLVLVDTSQAQGKIIKNEIQTWLQYYLNAKLTSKWSANFDAGYRRTDEFVNKPLQWLLRGGATYHLSNDVSFTAGYAYFSLHTITSKNEFDRSEHRPWLRLSIAHSYGKLQILHRYRFESRNIQKNEENGLLEVYNSYFRAGYQLNLQYPLNGEIVSNGIYYLIAYNELFVNFGSNVLNYFDQNRVYFGLGYGITNNANITLGYQYIYSQQNATTFASINTLRFNIIQNIDFRKPKEESKSDLE